MMNKEYKKYEIVIGLEVHAQIAAEGKLFSPAKTSFGESPNQGIALVDSALPGTLPSLNFFCVEQGIKTALALECKINLKSNFERKHYFYPDLPQGYQISQYKNPLATQGKFKSKLKDIGITRLHLEQDAGKSIHDRDPKNTLVDLNRSGTALMEIVTEPDLRSASETGDFLRDLRILLKALKTCSGNMEKGEFRADVNISVRIPGEALGTRCEIKNLNSVRFVQQAIEYESQRQIEILESGRKIQQETRLFETGSGKTRSMRSKEEAADYRYFPDPDLLPLKLDPKWVESLRDRLPELPEIQKESLAKLGIPKQQIEILLSEPEIMEYFDEAIRFIPCSQAADWICNELAALSNKSGIPIWESKVTPEKLGEVVNLALFPVISGTSAKELLGIIWNEEESSQSQP